ncbi:MAG: hypothetical protein MK538_09775 [Planctomycetes bacterium]|nr:hypothetical protein [Planctomycetota bacterium]
MSKKVVLGVLFPIAYLAVQVVVCWPSLVLADKSVAGEVDRGIVVFGGSLSDGAATLPGAPFPRCGASSRRTDLRIGCQDGGCEWRSPLRSELEGVARID